MGFPPAIKAWADYLWSGPLGVSLFFTMSGFLITYKLRRELVDTGKIELRRFAAKRVVRIIPTLYAYLVVACMLAIWLHRDFSTEELLAALSFTRNYYSGGWTLGHLWAVAVEVQFYLAWATVMACARKLKEAMAIAITGICIAPVFRILAYLSPWREASQYSFLAHMDTLLMGSMLALLIETPIHSRLVKTLEEYRQFTRIACALVIYGVWQLSVRGLMGFATVPFGPTVQGLAITILIASVVFVPGGLLFRILNLRQLASIGILSYGLYIWQQIILYPAAYPGGTLWWRQFPQNIPIIFLVAVLSFYLIEKPFLRKSKNNILNG